MCDGAARIPRWGRGSPSSWVPRPTLFHSQELDWADATGRWRAFPYGAGLLPRPLPCSPALPPPCLLPLPAFASPQESTAARGAPAHPSDPGAGPWGSAGAAGGVPPAAEAAGVLRPQGPLPPYGDPQRRHPPHRRPPPKVGAPRDTGPPIQRSRCNPAGRVPHHRRPQVRCRGVRGWGSSRTLASCTKPIHPSRAPGPRCPVPQGPAVGGERPRPRPGAGFHPPPHGPAGGVRGRPLRSLLSGGQKAPRRLEPTPPPNPPPPPGGPPTPPCGGLPPRSG